MVPGGAYFTKADGGELTCTPVRGVRGRILSCEVQGHDGCVATVEGNEIRLVVKGDGGCRRLEAVDVKDPHAGWHREFRPDGSAIGRWLHDCSTRFSIVSKPYRLYACPGIVLKYQVEYCDQLNA